MAQKGNSTIQAASMLAPGTKSAQASVVPKKSFDNLKNLLKNQKSQTGDDLHNHIQEIFKKLILHYPETALEKFEEVSYLTKHASTINCNDFLKTEDNRNYKATADDLVEYIQKLAPHLEIPKPEEEGGDLPEVAPVCHIQDLLADQRVFQWAGIGFGEQETYRLQKSLKKLAADKSATSMRFFGKIYGTQQDYYVVEAVTEGDDEENEGGDGDEGAAENAMEPRGTGVNKYSYFVTHNPLGEWQKLPDLKPQDIEESRNIKVVFTGDLERKIYTNPFFFGQEKHYLRAQIARISHSTTLLPQGTMRKVEDNDREIEENTPEDDSEIVMPTTNQMANINMWVHANLNILKNGRTAHLDPEEPEGAEDWDADKAKEAIEAADPYDARLKPIVQDSKVQISEKHSQDAWVVRLMGDSTEYASLKDSKQIVCNGVVVVRSLLWPGAYSFYQNGKQYQVYLGQGHKNELKTYFPVNPPEVLADPEEYGEGPEPTPLEAPPVEEKAEDDENEEEEENE